MRIPIFSDLLDLFFPRECPACRSLFQEESLLCSACRNALGDQRLTAATFNILEMPVLSAYAYAWPLDQIIPVAKSKNQPRLFDPLVEGMAASLREAGLVEYPQAIVPVPLHPSRRRERGYDQALYLARAVGRMLDLPVERRVLKRTRATPPQKAESRERRLEALHDSFSPGREASRVSDRRVLLIDDVVTTGATLSAAVMALQTASPAGVLCLTSARTERLRIGPEEPESGGGEHESGD
ncbi:ComF family protein [Gemmatimonadota bacterium]